MTDAPKPNAGCVGCEAGGELFFCGLSKSGPEHSRPMVTAVEHPRGDVLFLEGQAARGAYILCHGRVKLSSCSGEPRALITDIGAPGDVLGLSAVISGNPYEATAETLEKCRLIFIRREDFLRRLDEQAGAWMHVSRQLSRSYRAAHRQAVMLGLSPSAAAKLASVLLEHHALYDRRPGVPLTHEELGHIIGSSRETVTRLLSDFKRRRIVEVTGATILIRDRQALEALALAL